MIKKIDDIIKEQFESVSKDLGYPILKDSLAPETKKEIMDNLYNRRFDRLDKSESDGVRDLLIKAYDEGWTMKNLGLEISKVAPKLSNEDIQRIVQTENTTIVNTAREKGYKQTDPEGTRLYKWVSIPDQRRTPICKKISNRTSKGVHMDTLKKIVKEEGTKGGFEARELNPHINCRSVMVQA